MGDDAVTEAVTDLVRGDFATCFKAVLEHGMKRSLLGFLPPLHLLPSL